MDFLSAAKYRYYGKDDSQNILQKVNREIPQNISACKHELLCIMNEVINFEPCCYWNRQVFNQTDSALQSIATKLPALSIDDTIFEFFLEETCVDKQINETLVSGTIKVRETRVFCFCDVNSRSDPYGKKTVDTAFSVSAPTAAVAEEKMLLFENASGQKPLRRHYIR